jgi:hypothetical protein
MLMTQAEDDPNEQARSKTFLQALEQLATRRTARSATRFRHQHNRAVANLDETL